MHISGEVCLFVSLNFQKEKTQKCSDSVFFNAHGAYASKQRSTPCARELVDLEHTAMYGPLETAYVPGYRYKGRPLMTTLTKLLSTSQNTSQRELHATDTWRGWLKFKRDV